MENKIVHLVSLILIFILINLGTTDTYSLCHGCPSAFFFLMLLLWLRWDTWNDSLLTSKFAFEFIFMLSFE